MLVCLLLVTVQVLGSNSRQWRKVPKFTKYSDAYDSEAIYNLRVLHNSNSSIFVINITYNKTGPNNDSAVFVVPRRAYYDNRTHDGKPLNRLVILAVIHDDAQKSIVSCESNGYTTTFIKTFIQDTAWAKKYYPVTHRLMIIICKGLPREAIVNGTFPYVHYRKGKDVDHHYRIESEKPLVVTKHVDNDPSTFDKGKSSVVVCSAVFGHPDMFDQWLRYQKTLKVDMVHLNVEYSFYENATLLYPFLKESLENGFVQMEVWNDIVGSRAFYHEQLEKYQDCLYRYIGVFEYGVFYDCDDFFVPRLPDQKDIHFYLDTYLNNNVGSVQFKWEQLLCKPLPDLVKNLPDGNLTSILSGNKISQRNERKSAHRLNSLEYVYVHYAISRLPGYKYKTADVRLAYVGHVRNTFKMCP